jgi:hypothetical protein
VVQRAVGSVKRLAGISLWRRRVEVEPFLLLKAGNLLILVSVRFLPSTQNAIGGMSFSAAC